jgi:hypothetical protein
MPLRYTVDPARGWLLTTATGPITFEEIREHVWAERADEHLARPELVDGTAAEPAFTPAEVRRIVEVLRDLAATSRIGPTAVLVGSDFAFGMMRMLEILLGDVAPVRPFRKRDEAEAWLVGASARVEGEQPR